MRGLPIAVVLVPVIITVGLMMFFAHFPWMILVVFAIWIIWMIIKSKIDSAMGRRKEDIDTIQRQNNDITRLRNDLIEERLRNSKSKEDLDRRRKLIELEEILKSGRK